MGKLHVICGTHAGICAVAVESLPNESLLDVEQDEITFIGKSLDPGNN